MAFKYYKWVGGSDKYSHIIKVKRNCVIGMYVTDTTGWYKHNPESVGVWSTSDVTKYSLTYELMHHPYNYQRLTEDELMLILL